jgi:hypothetical protein
MRHIGGRAAPSVVWSPAVGPASTNASARGGECPAVKLVDDQCPISALSGILHGYFKTGTQYNENTAWQHQNIAAA